MSIISATLLRRLVNNRLYNVPSKYLLAFMQPKKRVLDNRVGITTLLCHDYVPMFIFNINSLFFAIGFSLPINIIDDGSLLKADKQILKKLLSVMIISEKTADAKMFSILKKYKNFLKYRFDNHNPISRKKWDAYLLSPYERTIYLDSNLLFFKKPKVLFDWIDKESDFVLHLEHSTGLLAHDYEREDFDLMFRNLLSKSTMKLVSGGFNTGLLAIPNSVVFNLEKIDAIFKIFNDSYYSRVFNSEETAMAASILDQNHLSLPSKHYVVACFFQEYEKISRSNLKKNITMLHYVYELKRFFERDAVELFFSKKFFRLP